MLFAVLAVANNYTVDSLSLCPNFLLAPGSLPALIFETLGANSFLGIVLPEEKCNLPEIQYVNPSITYDRF